MREIRFRGKRIDNGEWVIGFLEFHLVDGDLTKTKQDAFITYDYMDKIGKVYRDRFEVIPETVGQFTGLFDDSGTEIYDGDIIEIQDSTETTTSYQSPVCITHDGALVKYHPAHVSMGEVGMRKLSSYCDYGYGGKYNVSCKIIGNVHEASK